jgi:predicted transporter
LPSIIFKTTYSNKNYKMMMNKNTVLGYATLIMIIVGLILIGLGAFRYDDVAGWGFAAVGIGFFAIAWVFNALKGRV